MNQVDNHYISTTLSNPIEPRMCFKTKADNHTIVRVGVGVIIRNDVGWILLEKRSDFGIWGIPGGKIDPGESIQDAALREVKAETGLNVQITKLLGVYSEPANRILTYPDNGDVVHLVDILLEAEIISGNLTNSIERLDLRFFNPTALPLDLMPLAKAPLEDYIQGFTGIIR